MKFYIILIIGLLVSIGGGYYLGKKTKNTKTMKEINKHFESANSKGTKIIIGISCCLGIIGIILIITFISSSNDFIGKTYKMINTDDLATIYFESSDIVRVEYISKDDYSINEAHLKYRFKNDTLTITTETGSNMIYTYDKSTDCFKYSSSIKYCH